MNLKDWKSLGNYFSFKGNQIFYIDKGKGETLLLIHGFPTSSHDFNKIYENLVLNYRVITLDMLGFGFSDKPLDLEYSIFLQAELYIDFLNFLKIDKYHILCHDYGVTVTQEILNLNEDKILSVCFLNGGLFPETHRPRLIQKLLLSPLGFILSRFISKKSFVKSFREVFGEKTKPSPEELDEYWEVIQYNEGYLNSHKLIRYMKERIQNRERWVSALLNSVPKRLINGPADPISGRHMAIRYKEILKDSDVVFLSDWIGHYPQVEDPESVLKYYFEFLNSIKSKKEKI
jgi:pimeloyl-ACP methyl ester carboxylesterase